LAQPNPKAEAASHFERGLALAKQKAYLEAITEFNLAYQASPHFSVMYNLGQAYLAIDQPAYAVLALRRYLAEGKTEIPPARREQVEATIAAQERRFATLTIRADLVGAVVRIDGSEIGRTPLSGPVRLGAGSHLLEATLPGYKPWEQRLFLNGQEQTLVDIRFEPAVVATPPATPAVSAPVPMPGPAATPQASAPMLPAQAAAAPPVAATPSAQPAPAGTELAAIPPTAPAPSRARTVTALVVGAVGVGSLVTGSVFGLRAFAKKSDSDKECPNERCSPEGVRLNNQAKDAATLSTISFGVGLAAVGVATYLLLSPGSARPSSTPPSSRIEVAPEVGRGQAGLAVRGVW
jgi:hypothetical protein